MILTVIAVAAGAIVITSLSKQGQLKVVPLPILPDENAELHRVRQQRAMQCYSIRPRFRASETQTKVQSLTQEVTATQKLATNVRRKTKGVFDHFFQLVHEDLFRLEGALRPRSYPDLKWVECRWRGDPHLVPA